MARAHFKETYVHGIKNKPMCPQIRKLPPTASTGDERDRDEDEVPAKRPRQEGEESSGARVSPDAARTNSNHSSSWWAVKAESDDADSRCSYSSTSTPPPDTEESRPQVVAARGDSIIAVANPALQPPHPARNHSN